MHRTRFEKVEEGSGTMAGAMLVMVVGVALAVVACVGNLMVCQSRARSLADLAAFSAAYVAWHEDAGDPCALAVNTVSASGATASDCAVRGDDVWVTVAVETKVPLAFHVERTSRAGPMECTRGVGE